MMTRTWKDHAAVMAADVVPASSRWRGPLESVPRHVFVPSWWERDGTDWVSVYGPPNSDRWHRAVYQDTSLITRVGPQHADVGPGVRRTGGRPTSSSTHPSLLIQMYEHAQLADGLDVLDVGTGSGYGTALLATHLGAQHVTSVDVDPYLVKAARDRLDALVMVPKVIECDATVEVPGTYDRIIATVGVSPIPAAWIDALRPGGRIVTVLDGTEAILTAEKQDDGTLAGRIERDWAGFMSARHGEDYPAASDERVRSLLTLDPESSQVGLYPLADLGNAWELHSTLAVSHPGIQHYWEQDADGLAVQLLWDDQDGSWARAEGVAGQLPTVDIGGPVNLWRKLEGLKKRWLIEGRLPLYGARAHVDRDGAIRLERGNWNVVIPAAQAPVAR